MAQDIISHLTDIKQAANELFDIWKRFGADECYEQIEAHLESAGYRPIDIAIALDELEPQFDAKFGMF